MIQSDVVHQYCTTNDLLPGAVFFRAYKAKYGRDMSPDQQQKVCKDLAGYQVHNYIPEYVRLFCSGG